MLSKEVTLLKQETYILDCITKAVLGISFSDHS